MIPSDCPSLVFSLLEHHGSRYHDGRSSENEQPFCHLLRSGKFFQANRKYSVVQSDDVRLDCGFLGHW